MKQFLPELMWIFRLLVSCLCGCAVGFERQRHIRAEHRKSAGMRTHMIVCVASTAMMLISKYGFFDVLAYGDNVRVDVSRVAAGILAGISFLGAGTIFVRKESINGLTTAAGLWAVAAVGMAIGCGMYTVGVTLTILILLIQELFRMGMYQHEKRITTIVIALSDINATKDVLQWLHDNEVEIYGVVSKRGNGRGVQLTIRVCFADEGDEERLFAMQEKIDAVESVEY